MAMAELRWLTRVPLSIKAAATLVDEVVELTPSILKGYSLKESRSEYADIEQRWILVESQARRNSDLKQLTKKIEQYQQKSQQEFQALAHQEFACAADALNAANKLSKIMKWHQLWELEIIEKPHYGKAGKPKQDAVPTRISYHITGTVIPIDSEIADARSAGVPPIEAHQAAAERVRCGRFILATNVLDSSQLSADEALREYKAQQGVERGFRFLKDPLFFTSSVTIFSLSPIPNYFYGFPTSGMWDSI